LKAVEDSVKLAEDLNDIWTGKEFQKMFKIV
jgi:hypothetical protein